MQKIKVGIIGCGDIARAHMCDYWYDSQEAEVVACADLVKERHQDFVKKFNIAKSFEKESDLLKLPEVGAVDICTPPALHTRHALEAIAAGKHVITEKPFALDFESAKKAVEKAEKANVKLMVMQNYRWRPEYQRAKGMIEAGRIGTPLFITTQMHHSWSAYAEYRKKMEKMLIFEASIHYIDLLRYLLDSEPKEVYAKIGTSPKREDVGETRATIIFQFKDGWQAVIVNSAHCLGGRVNVGGETIIEGTEGTIWCNRDKDFSFSSYSNPGGGYAPEVVLESPKWFEAPLRCFIESISKDIEPPTSGKDNLNTLKAVLAAYRSVDEKKPVEI